MPRVPVSSEPLSSARAEILGPLTLDQSKPTVAIGGSVGLRKTAALHQSLLALQRFNATAEQLLFKSEDHTCNTNCCNHTIVGHGAHVYRSERSRRLT